MPGSPRSKGRTGRPWRRVRERMVRIWRADHSPCWLCGQPINWDLPRTDAMSGTADHVIPLSLGGPPQSPDLLRPAHLRCNSKRGARPAVVKVAPAVNTSRTW